MNTFYMDKLPLEQWLQGFKELDLLGDERPSGFSLETAIKEVRESGLIAEFEKRFGTEGYHHDETWTFLVDQWPNIQDATYHTGLLIKGWDSALPQDRLEIRLSNFGRLACIYAIDEAEPDEELLALICDIVKHAGYTLLNNDILNAEWNDCRGHMTCARERFFDYR